MATTNEAATPRGMLTARPGASRKLLSRKAAERHPSDAPDGEAIEASFPAAEAEGPPCPTVTDCGPEDDHVADKQPAAPGTVAIEPATAAPPPASPPAPAASSAWSDEDESTFQALAARRKAAGRTGRGKDVGSQLIGLGRISPNPETVVAVIVGLVADRGGSIQRADLLAAMAAATYPHGNARPDDKAWCQGYVAGAVRNGFLTADALPATVAEAA